MENIRGNRAKRCVCAYDKEIKLIHKITRNVYEGFYMNVYNKIYWFEDDTDIIWLKEDRYDEYEIQEIDWNV